MAETLRELSKTDFINSYDFLNIASRILFIKIVNILKKTKNKPNHPKIIAMDSKLEPISP